MTSITIHVIYQDVVTAGDSYTVVLIDDNAVSHFCVVRCCQIKTFGTESAQQPSVDIGS